MSNREYVNETKTMSTLYLTLVRSQVGYATQVWSPQSVELISRLERVQRRASKYILGLPFLCEASYEQRLKKLKLLPNQLLARVLGHDVFI